MKPSYWAMLGLAFDIVGAFLLAVEAIKVENLQRLRTRFLLPMHIRILPRPFAIDIPEPVDGRDSKAPPEHPMDLERSVVVLKAPSNVKRRLFSFVDFLLHLLAGFVVLVVIDGFLDGSLLSLWRPAKEWIWGLGSWLFFPTLIVALYFFVMILLLLGEIVHMLLIRASKVAIEVITLIERETESGVVGIVGFLLMLVGFLFQMYASYLQTQ
jgi:hypothetical protein